VNGIYFSLQYVPRNSSTPPTQNDPLKSFWSYDAGKQWNLLNPPPKGADGVPYNCSVLQGCGLNLHGNRWIDTIGLYVKWTFLYSTDEALGITVATGNVGDSLDKQWKVLNTFMTIDGGLSWKEITKGQYFVDIGDHGGIILLADNLVPTTEILYTLDFGNTFTSCNITDSPLDVRIILSVPTEISRKFIVYGLRNDTASNSSKAVIVQVDMTNVFPRQCTDSDYEWVSQIGRIECLLGKKTMIKRRKPDSLCYNGEEHESVLDVSNCSCSLQDYECVECYDYDPVKQMCVFVCLNDSGRIDLLPNPSCKCKQFYDLSGYGWRKIADDWCNETLKDSILLKDLRASIPCVLPNKPCIKPSNSGAEVAEAVVLTFVSLVLFIALLIVLYQKSPRFQELIATVLPGGNKEAERVKLIND